MSEEKKDIESLKDEVLNQNLINKDGYIYAGDLTRLLKQLDEPETLSQEWIDKNTVHVRGLGDIIEAETVENLLVLKQELPVIPKFVADKIEQSKADGIHSVGVIFHGALNREYDEFLNNWILNNEKLFIEAFFAYPNIEVEEEQKYRVLDGNTTLLGRINGLMLTTVEILEYYPEYAPTFVFTEKEIKDYDERFWPFAVKVEELKK